MFNKHITACTVVITSLLVRDKPLEASASVKRVKPQLISQSSCSPTIHPGSCARLTASRWCHSKRDGVSNHQPHDCLFRRRSQKTSKLRVTGLCAGNSPVTGEFPAQMASYAENVSIWWRHHENIWWPCILLCSSSCREQYPSQFEDSW